MDPLVLASTTSISPLPPEDRTGIIAMSLIGFASFLSCALLFLYITYRLLKSRWGSPAPDPREESDQAALAHRHEFIPDLPPSASRRQLSSDLKKHRQQESEAEQLRLAEEAAAAAGAGRSRSSSNSSLTLIHNLLMADMVQAFAFVFGFSWWHRDGIFVESPTCGAQAFFINLGSVSISLFLISISLNTLLIIVWGYRLSRLAVRSMMAFNWILSFVLAFIGLGVARSKAGHDEPPYYARSNALCWINLPYVSTYGFWLQNLWLVISMGITVACYAWVFVALLRNQQSSREMPPRDRRRRRDRNAPPEPSGHHPAFLVYPAVYILSSGPITLLGLLASSGIPVSSTAFVGVTTLSSLAGLLDAVLWSTTILFSSSRDLEEVGLGTYQFMRTPSRLYGNMVWVEGATAGGGDGGGGGGEAGEEGGLRDRRWWKLHSGGDGRPSRTSHEGKDVDDNIILMNTVTSVTVDVLESGRSSPSASGHRPDI